MNYSVIRYITGYVITVVSAFMLLPAAVSALYRESTALIFLSCALVFGTLGFIIRLKKPKEKRFFAREGFIVVTLSWLIISLIGAVPFTLSGEIPFYIDAVFEIISGFTTTGASVLTNVEALSHGMRFWRCFSNWLGGMGVLVFILAIIPTMGGGQGLYVMKAESTGPSVGKLVPKVRQSAEILYMLYILLSVIQIILLLVTGMPLFDAACVTFGTAGTGGFAVLNDSIASYSVAAKNIISVFMLLFGVNFNIYFLLIARKFKEAVSSEELRWYFIIYLAATAAVGASLFVSAREHFNLTDVFFQTSSIMTTTGFATTDFNLWTPLAKSVLVILMFIGTCAGSTGGGIKISRLVIYMKTVRKQLSALIHPRSVKILKMDGKPISHEIIRIVNVYLCTLILFFVASFLLVLTDGFDIVTSFTAVAATLNNIGPGLGEVGPVGNYAAFSPLVKCVLSIDMLAGRLELFPLIIFFSPSAWRRN